MRNDAAGGLAGGAPCGHAVRVYGDEHELACRVAAYLAEGFERGEPAIAIVTSGHRRGIVDALRPLGWDERLLTTADAEGTLASFLESSGPSAERFHTVVGRLLESVRRRHPGKPVRLFGEMVDLLARRGRLDAALALEELWDGLVRRRGLSLLCAYGLDLFDAETQRRVLPRVYRAHGRVEVSADPTLLDEAVARALRAELGRDEAERVRRVAADARRDAHIPAPHAALMWVSARMPAAAERILAAARATYESPALARGR